MISRPPGGLGNTHRVTCDKPAFRQRNTPRVTCDVAYERAITVLIKRYCHSFSGNSESMDIYCVKSLVYYRKHNLVEFLAL